MLNYIPWYWKIFLVLLFGGLAFFFWHQFQKTTNNSAQIVTGILFASLLVVFAILTLLAITWVFN